MSLIKTIKERWSAESPKFFKGVKKLAITLGTSATAIWTANSTMNLNLDSVVLGICKYTIAATIGMGLTAQLTKTDNTQNV
jgi:hypothetical protein